MSRHKDTPNTTNEVNPAYSWQNNQTRLNVKDSSKLIKALLIIAGLALFFGIAYLLAFV